MAIHCLRTERKMARCFAKVSEEEIKTALFYASDLVSTKTTIPLRVSEERWLYTSTLRVSVYIHHYSPHLQGIVVYYSLKWRALTTMPTMLFYEVTPDTIKSLSIPNHKTKPVTQRRRKVWLILIPFFFLLIIILPVAAVEGFSFFTLSSK